MVVTEESVKARWNERARMEINPHDALLEREGYITIGYYKPDTETLGQSMKNMPLRLVEIGEINSESRVLDLGCGKGRPLLDVAVATGCSVVGVDLADGHIDIANGFKDKYLLEHPTLKAEFYAASYFELPAAVTQQTFTHVVMQTSLFYNHHKIDQLLSSVSTLLVTNGKMMTTDFLRKASAEDVAEFLTFNSMSLMLSMDEMKEAFTRHGMEYCGGEDIDQSCIKCNTMKKAKAAELRAKSDNFAQLNPAFFECRRSYVESGKVTFQIVMAKKL